MTYKTILVHCNDNRRIKTLLAPVLTIANKFQSHVVGLSVVPPISVISVGALATPPVIVDGHCELYRQQVPAMRRQFEEAISGNSITTEWRNAAAGPFGVSDVVLQHGRTADVIVASQADEGWPAGRWLDVADRLALESGRPVLIVPNGRPSAQIGNRILVAWNGRREATRAVFDALPLLRHALATKVVCISESDSFEELSPDICPTLVRHGVKADETETVTSQAGVGPDIMAQAEAFDADLVVMGCYGHSRLREFVLGGATRHALQKMRLAVLMSH